MCLFSIRDKNILHCFFFRYFFFSSVCDLIVCVIGFWNSMPLLSAFCMLKVTFVEMALFVANNAELISYFKRLTLLIVSNFQFTKQINSVVRPMPAIHALYTKP